MEDTTAAIPRLYRRVIYILSILVVCLLNLVLYLYTSTHPIDTNHPKPAYYDERDYTKVGDFSRALKSTNGSALQRLLLPSTPPTTCYRQVQFWKGPTSAVKPAEYACPGVKCGIRYVEDKSMETMRNSHAVVLFHRAKWDWAAMHKRRPPGQKWLFYSLESPIHTKKGVIPPEPYYNNSYDYTIGYRDGVTFDATYGYFDPTEPEIGNTEQPRNWAAEKPRLVAWMASNCGTTSWRRTTFVRALSKHIKVDMYGRCGNKQCPRKSEDCTKLLQTYKFYLALENSECRDYITEKFWRNSLLNGIVPVAYGTVKKDYERVAPPHSFIHLHDFKSIKEVADYLYMVAKNETLYNSYLEWKRHGSIKFKRVGAILGPQYLCQVVARVIEDEEKTALGIKLNSSVPDLNMWWRNSCKNVGSGFPRTF